MLERSGYFAVIKRSFGRLSDDQRVQAVLIAFCFGALLEALAGFGTPVAICSVMLIGLGFQPAKAAGGRPRGQHRAGGLRRHRGADHDAGAARQPAQGRPRRDGRPPDALPGPRRPADPGRHGRRAPRHQGRLARSTGGRPRLRHRPVRVLELPLGRAGRRRRLAGRRRRDHRAAAVLAARRGRRRARRPAPGHGRRRERRRPAALREGGAPARRRRARRQPQARHPGRDHHRLLAVPDPHRRLRPGPDPLAAVLRLARRAHQGLRLARAAHPQRARARRRRRSPSSSTGPTRPARCC